MTDKQVTALGYCKCAAVSWLLYDIVLTMGDEINYIWRRRWSMFTFLFFLARYVPLLAVTSSAATSLFPDVDPKVCDIFQWVEAACTFVALIVVQVIMQFRLYVMYQKSRKVLLANIFLCIVEVAIAVALVIIEFTKTVPLPNSPFVYGSCFSLSPREIAVVLLAPLAYESYLAILAINKTFQTNRARLALGKRTNLMSLLVRDNIFYFLLIAGTLIWVTLVWFFYPVSPGNSLISFTQVSGSIGGTRLILSVRRTALKPNSTSIATTEPTSGIEMRSPKSPRRPRSFHATQGPSFGNLDGMGIDDTDMNDDDLVSPVSGEDLISPIDYGRPTRSHVDSGIHVINDRWAAVSGRQNGLSKAMDALRSMP
ncbi:hypothetical protein BKA62DRAFT_431288 [Auriculariales sp. MPI-PUGE-AT-0066]|nr:hypothetical protein BKA62DRAFT_431288 [Auriculariales sp. MPI-PUGE-AT-0066]